MATPFNLQQHLSQEHRISPFQTYLKEIVYGGNDGIVTTFAIVAGFAGANLAVTSSLGFMTVLLFKDFYCLLFFHLRIGTNLMTLFRLF